MRPDPNGGKIHKPHKHKKHKKGPTAGDETRYPGGPNSGRNTPVNSSGDQHRHPNGPNSGHSNSGGGGGGGSQPQGGGRAPESYIHRGGGGGGHHHHKKKHHKGGGGGGSSKPRKKGVPLRTQAGRIVQSDINQAVKALEREKATRGKAKDFDIAKLTSLWQRQKGDLTHVYNEVDENTNLQNKKIDARFNTGRADVKGLFGSLAAKLAASASTNKSAATAEQNRLGIGQAGMGSFDADAANAQNTASVNAANSDANLGAMQTGAAQVGGMLSSMGHSSYAGAVGRSLNSRNDGIAEALNSYRASVDDIYNQERTEQGTKASKTQELFTQMDDRRFARQESNRNYALQKRSQQFSENSSNNSFNLSVSRFNSDNLWKAAAQRQEDRRQAALRRQQAAAARGM